MYNPHRGLGPTAPNSRLTELLDQVRQEFDATGGRAAAEYEQQLAQQVHEMELVRAKVYQMEQAQIAMKQKYEDDIARLRHEVEQRGGSGQPPHTTGPSHGAPSQPPPPSIGHGPSNLFGGIMTGNAGQGGPGLAPPPQEPIQPQGLPPHMPQGPPGLNPPPGPPQPPPFGYPPAANGYGPQGPQPTASPGPGRSRPGRGPPGPATPQQNSAAPYPGSPQVPRPTPPPGQVGNRMPLQQHPSVPDVGNTLAELDVRDVPASHKREGSDWFAIFNPRLPRTLDVDLVHNLPHQSVVCCVRFSMDGRYVATGCNRSAQIYDVENGGLVAHLQDGSLSDDGDLYIRSVCFSPDGKFLATGAEDKVIRVWDIANRTIKCSFTGHDQDIYSLDFSRNGQFIASGSGDRSVRLWDINSNQQILSMVIDDGVTTVAISPDNRLVAAGSLDKSVRVWDTSSGYLVERLEGEIGHKDSVYSVAFAPNGRDLVSGSLDKTIKMWELTAPPRVAPGGGPRGGKCIKTFEGHKDFVLSVALTPGGEWVLSGSKDRGVQFWDPHTGVAQLMLQGHKNSVISVAPSPTGKLFATGSGDMRARIWRYEDYRGAP
ncbi:WD40 repeat-like protein [Aulographum hederae CBS 113979]|uniref:WD40 repeat-like protein n=1 Tax=Aulographum hederae CBS 113979 TaxID=1176131 RepID=A0A6G1GR60_9PEZI|nr:WD40 repeat-like protein [Aulographum hederae CBS 113979]